MRVRDLMTVAVKTAAPETTTDQIATMMRDEDTGVIPVVKDGQLIGVITDRDIVILGIANGEDAARMTADELLSERLETIEPDADLEEAAQLMARSQVRRLPVVENGMLVGMLSLGDIAIKASADQAGKILQGVSRGVKPTRSQRRQASGHKLTVREKGRTRAAKQRLNRERGASRIVSGGRKGKQGIAHRDIGKEVSGRAKVVPIRKEGKTARKRRAS